MKKELDASNLERKQAAARLDKVLGKKNDLCVSPEVKTMEVSKPVRKTVRLVTANA
jgi:hypothetical protein